MKRLTSDPWSNWRASATWVSLACGVTLLLLPIFTSGCAGGRQQSTYRAAPQPNGSTPAQHARSQLQWLRARGGDLTPEQLHLLQQIPWNSGFEVDLARQRLLERGNLYRDGTEEFQRHRVLGRPRVMDAAREALQQESDALQQEASGEDGSH